MPQFSQIRELLYVWAAYSQDRQGHGYPKQSAFASIRVDGGNRSTDTYIDETPKEVIAVEKEIDKMPPPFKAILAAEYIKRGSQSKKAIYLGIDRRLYAERLRHIHEHLMWVMYGIEIQPKNSTTGLL